VILAYCNQFRWYLAVYQKGRGSRSTRDTNGEAVCNPFGFPGEATWTPASSHPLPHTDKGGDCEDDLQRETIMAKMT